MEKSLTISVLNGDLLGVTVETRVQKESSEKTMLRSLGIHSSRGMEMETKGKAID